MRIELSPNIAVLFSATFDRKSELSRFSCFYATAHRPVTRRAFTFVCNTFAVTHRKIFLITMSVDCYRKYGRFRVVGENQHSRRRSNAADFARNWAHSPVLMNCQLRRASELGVELSRSNFMPTSDVKCLPPCCRYRDIIGVLGLYGACGLVRFTGRMFTGRLQENCLLIVPRNFPLHAGVAWEN